MELITKRDIIDELLDHTEKHEWLWVTEIGRIKSMTDPTLDELTAAINNIYLTQCKCDECGQEVDVVVGLGDNGKVCQECLQKALALFPKL